MIHVGLVECEHGHPLGIVRFSKSPQEHEEEMQPLLLASLRKKGLAHCVFCGTPIPPIGVVVLSFELDEDLKTALENLKNTFAEIQQEISDSPHSRFSPNNQ